jgi:hypothetical protein
LGVQIVDEPELLARARASVKRLGLIAGGNAEGFLIDLDYGLEGEAGLDKVRVKKTGEDDCRFRVTGHFDGPAQEALHAILRVLEEQIAYDPEQAVASYSVQPDAVVVRFLTHNEFIGAATVCIRALPRP